MKIHENLEQLPTFKNAVVTIGSFDGVHKGHKAIFNRINKIANKYNGESVVVTFHPHPRSVIFPQDDSLKLLTLRDEKVEELKKLAIDHLVVVPFTVEFSQLQAEEYIENFIHKKFNPKCIVIGYDHKFGRNREGDVSLLREYGSYLGFEVIEIEKQSVEQISISSTKIRKAIQDGKITEANALLGHNYGLIGKVEHGNKLGHQLGFPTANIKVENSLKLLPPIGIYSATVQYNNQLFGAMLYYGSKPSVEEGAAPLIEVNIFDFNEEIYDEEILIRFVSFIREDRTFEDLNKLRHQLRLDRTKAKNHLEEFNALNVVKKKTTAVVLLNYNGKGHLAKYLPELLKHSKADEVSVHLVDNASTDDSVQWVRKNHPEVVVHTLNENHGFAKGYNLGLDKIQSDYYAILNNDVRVTENWLPPIIQRLESDPLIAAVQPKIKSDKNSDYFEYAGAAGGGMDFFGYPFCRGRIFDTAEKDNGQYETPTTIFWASGAAMLIKSDLFYRAGGFDSLYFAHQEEIDLSWRLLRAGYRIYYEPNSTVYHLGGGTLSYGDEKKVFLNFRNNVITLIKNELAAKFAWLAITRVILDLIASLRFLLDKKPKASKAVLKAYWFVLMNIPKLYQKRKLSAKRVREIRSARNTKSTVNDVRFNSSIIYHYFIRNTKTYSELSSK